MVINRSPNVQFVQDEKLIPRKAKDVHLHYPEIFSNGRLDNAVGIAKSYFDTNEVTLFASTAWLKPAGGTPKPPHQDAAHWTHVIPTDFLTVWIALDPSTVDNGGVHYLPMGGDRTLRRHVRGDVDYVLDTPVQKALGLTEDLQPGDASVHTGFAIHWSEPNTSTRPRRGLALAFAHPDIDSSDHPGMFDSFLRL